MSLFPPSRLDCFLCFVCRSYAVGTDGGPYPTTTTKTNYGNNTRQSPREWKAWFLSSKPEESALPGDWENKCSDLQRLCVLRSLRPDRILFSAATYVSNNLGPQFADPPAFDLKVRSVLDVVCSLPVARNVLASPHRFSVCREKRQEFCVVEERRHIVR